MRSLLVDWMVDVQENFELNHETLYLGVKITDLYLSHVVVAKENLQLVGAAALFLASKYEVIIIKFQNFNDVILTLFKNVIYTFFFRRECLRSSKILFTFAKMHSKETI